MFGELRCFHHRARSVSPGDVPSGGCGKPDSAVCGSPLAASLPVGSITSTPHFLQRVFTVRFVERCWAGHTERVSPASRNRLPRCCPSSLPRMLRRELPVQTTIDIQWHARPVSFMAIHSTSFLTNQPGAVPRSYRTTWSANDGVLPDLLDSSRQAALRHSGLYRCA